ncbi:hypothetical protein [Nonlabens antarcticus]|nr:hypothetical protein [Nonlabens antarcticus]
MPKLYNQFSSSERVNHLGPKPETINRILAYSKALSVHRVGNMTIETLNN